MTDTSITLTAFGCALVLLVALEHWLYLERQWLRIQSRRQNQLVNARIALSQQPKPRQAITISRVATPTSTDVTIEQVGETWEDWLTLAERSANDDGLRPREV